MLYVNIFVYISTIVNQNTITTMKISEQLKKDAETAINYFKEYPVDGDRYDVFHNDILIQLASKLLNEE